MKLNSTATLGFTLGCILLIFVTNVNAQYNSIYNSNGTVKTVEERKYDERQQKRNAVNSNTEQSKNNVSSSSSNSQGTFVKTESTARNYPTAEYTFSKKVGDLSDGLQMVSRELSSYGYPDEIFYGFANESGEVVIPLVYRWADAFKNGVAKVYENDPLANFLINKDGSKVSDGYYRQMAYFKEGMSVVTLYGKNGYINREGKEVISLKYNGAHDFSEGLAGVALDTKWGFINNYGFEVIPFEFDDVKGFSEGFAGAKLNDKWGFIDKKGSVIIPYEYDRVEVFSEGLASVTLDGKSGYIDKTGKIVVPIIYYDTEEFKNGEAKVRTSISYGSGATWIIIKNPVLKMPVVNSKPIKKETSTKKITSPVKKTGTPIKKVVKTQ